MYSFFFTYLVGPPAALLPSRWRRSLPFANQIHWQSAAILSGILEFAAAVIALGYWYIFEMTRISDRIIDSATSGKLSVSVTTTQVSGAALIVFALHPLTWLLVYLLFEATVRVCGAAFTHNISGILPLFLLDRFFALFSKRAESLPGEQLGGNVKSFFSSIHEHLRVSRLEVLPDALNYSSRMSEEFLEIYSSRRKPDWDPPKTVRVDDLYYRLEKVSVEKGTRPFRYTLRRLDRGAPGRNVLLYNSSTAETHSPRSAYK
jgi:hypothetical protein